MTESALLSVKSLRKYFPVRRGVFSKTVDYVRAVDDISFEIYPGETLGLVGESGCGKSTVGRALLHLYPPTSGEVWFDGRDISAIPKAELQKVRRDLQIVFQDPFSSLNPRMRVFDIVGEALQVHGVAKGEELRQMVLGLLQKVGVSPRWVDRYAHEFSGGQRQRIGIARAIALNPKLVVCDEAVSALDVSIQAQVLNLLIRLRQELGLSYLFISHDLSVVRHISHRVMVMYLGQIVELASTKELFEQPAHPYTRALLSAVPVPDPRHKVHRVVLQGDVPTPISPPSGCRFHTRCPAVFERCSQEEPVLYTLGKSKRTVKCFHAEGLPQEDWYLELLERLNKAESQAHAAHACAQPDEAAGNEDAAVTSGDEHRPASPPDEPHDASQAESRAHSPAPAVPVAAPVEERDSEEEEREIPASLVRGSLAALLGIGSLALLSFTDQRFFGLCLMLIALPLLPRRPWDGRLPKASVELVILILLWMASGLLIDSRRLRLAKHELSALSTQLQQCRANVGEYPKQLSRLGYRLGFIFQTDSARDPWGNPYQYSVDPKQPSKDFKLWSLGPDGKKSDDDIHGAHK